MKLKPSSGWPRSPTAMVSCYFNDYGSLRLRENYHRFCRSARQSNIPLYTIELVSDDSESVGASVSIRRKTQSACWQKERLLNQLVSLLPDWHERIVWADCDIEFVSADWDVVYDDMLSRFVLIHGFNSYAWTNRQGGDEFAGKSFLTEPLCRWTRYFHPGFVWGAQRSFWDRSDGPKGIYDQAGSGSGDLAIPLCLLQGPQDAKTGVTLAHAWASSQRYRDWAARFGEWRRNEPIVAAPVHVRHLWHGDWTDRKYYQFEAGLMAIGFDADRDVVTSWDGLVSFRTPPGESTSPFDTACQQVRAGRRLAENK